MAIGEAHTVFGALSAEVLAFTYSGAFRDQHTARLIDLTESILQRAMVSRPLRNKLAFAMVETYQNIIRHRAPNVDARNLVAARSIFMLRSRKNSHFIVAANPVHRLRKEEVGERIRRINRMDRAELKEVFLKGLADNSISDKGGAGLGLIEMVRRTGNPLGHRFVELDADHYMFYLLVTVGEYRKEEAEDELDKAVEHQAWCVEQDLLLLHKGELSATAISALLPLVQRDLDDRPQSSAQRSRAFLAAMEIFRGTDAKGDGLFMLCSAPGGYRLIAGQQVDRTTSGTIKAQVKKANEMPREKLSELFRTGLKAQTHGQNLKGVGAVDLALCAKEPINVQETTQHGVLMVSVSAMI